MADTVDISINAGETWWYEVTLSNDDETPLNLTGYTARMYLKRNYRDAIPELMLTTENDRIDIAALTGVLTFGLDADVTADLSGSYKYDIEIISSAGEVTRLMQGNVKISPEVTH